MDTNELRDELSDEFKEAFDDLLDYASFWMRFGAYIVDILIICLITLPILISYYGAEDYFESEKIFLGWFEFMRSQHNPSIIDQAN